MSSNHYEWNLGEPLPVLGEHSVAKHEIFDQYMGVYIDRLTRTPSQTMLNLTVVDGFCGGGLYRHGRDEAEGSPLRLLRAVARAEEALNAVRRKEFAVRADFFFVDENPKHITFLQDILERRNYGSRLGQDIFLICSTFEEACATIIQHIQKKVQPIARYSFSTNTVGAMYGWLRSGLSCPRYGIQRFCLPSRSTR